MEKQRQEGAEECATEDEQNNNEDFTASQSYFSMALNYFRGGPSPKNTSQTNVQKPTAAASRKHLEEGATPDDIDGDQKIMMMKQKKKCLTSASLAGNEPELIDCDTVDAIAFIDPSGDETEEIEDLRMIKRGTNFPLQAKTKKKKGSHQNKTHRQHGDDEEVVEALKQHSKNSAIKRNRSHQQMTMLAAAVTSNNVGKKQQKLGAGSSHSSENDTDE